VIALRSGHPILTLLGPRQAFKSAVVFFDFPAYVPCVFRDLRPQRLLTVMGNDPVTGALWGDPLEEPPHKRNLLQFAHAARDPTLRRPRHRVQRPVALLLAPTPQAVTLQGGEADPLTTVNSLESVRRRVPAIKPDRARADRLLGQGMDKHFLEMLVLRLPVHLRGIPPRINRIKVLVRPPLCTQFTTPLPFTPRCSLPLS